MSHWRLFTTLSAVLESKTLPLDHPLWYRTDRLYKAGIQFYRKMRKEGYYILSLELSKFDPVVNVGGTWDIVYVRRDRNNRSYAFVVCDYKSTFVASWGQATCFQLFVYALLLLQSVYNTGSTQQC